jgi:hypothetical protein
MNDYKLIWASEGAANPVSVADLNAIHADHFSWLSETLAHIRGTLPSARIVVLTHHLPTHRMISPKFMGNPLNSCFASSALERCAAAVKPHCWIFGHSHIRDWKILDGVLCCINSHGYEGEHADGGNALNAVIDLTVGNVEGLVPIAVPSAIEAGASRKRPRPAMEEDDEEIILL